MRRKWRRIFPGLRERLLLIRLHFVRIEKPEDARTPEQMLEEIKEKSELT